MADEPFDLCCFSAWIACGRSFAVVVVGLHVQLSVVWVWRMIARLTSAVPYVSAHLRTNASAVTASLIVFTLSTHLKRTTREYWLQEFASSASLKTTFKVTARIYFACPRLENCPVRGTVHHTVWLMTCCIHSNHSHLRWSGCMS